MATGELSGTTPAVAGATDGGRPAEKPRQQAKLVFASFFLLIVVAVLYGLAFLTGRRRKAAPG